METKDPYKTDQTLKIHAVSPGELLSLGCWSSLLKTTVILINNTHCRNREHRRGLRCPGLWWEGLPDSAPIVLGAQATAPPGMAGVVTSPAGREHNNVAREERRNTPMPDTQMEAPDSHPGSAWGRGLST